MSKTAVYCRVSTENQEREGTSLESQLAACVVKAKELGLEAPMVFSEAYSGLTMERPRLAELRELIRTKAVDTVIAYALDRLSRDPVHFILLQEEMERAGCTLILVTETVDSSDMGKLISHIRGFAAKLEAEKIKERTTRGKRVRLAHGHLTTGVVLYGYTWNKETKKRVINENEAPIVRRIFSQIATGVSGFQIAVQLNKESIPAHGGGLWYVETVKRVARNLSYAGVTIANRRSGKKVDGKTVNTVRPENEWVRLTDVTPVIINSELFEQVQKELIRARDMRKGHPDSPYLLTGHIVCGDCGARMTGTKSKNHTRIYRYYRCRNTYITEEKTRSCTSAHIRADAIEEWAWERIEETILHPEALLARLKSEQSGESADVVALDAEIKAVQKRLSGYEDRRRRVLALFANKEDFGEDNLLDMVSKINNDRKADDKKLSELTAIRARIASLANIEIQITEYSQLMRANLPDFTFEDKRNALDAFDVTVKASGDNWTITGFANFEINSIVGLKKQQSPLPFTYTHVHA